jgi:hypothetical protein
MLRELLGWPERQARAWADDAIAQFGDNAFLTHEWAAHSLAPLLIPAEVRERVGARFNYLTGVLDIVIHARDPRGCGTHEAGYNWDAARERVRRVLTEAGAGTDPADIPI